MRRSAAFTVIILCRDKAPYTRHCVESLLSVTDDPVELICVDNGSEDDTLDTLRALQKSLLGGNKRIAALGTIPVKCFIIHGRPDIGTQTNPRPQITEVPDRPAGTANRFGGGDQYQFKQSRNVAAPPDIRRKKSMGDFKYRRYIFKRAFKNGRQPGVSAATV
jgi:glycosyltransferase involved in cell wall biosynthesis